MIGRRARVWSVSFSWNQAVGTGARGLRPVSVMGMLQCLATGHVSVGHRPVGWWGGGLVGGLADPEPHLLSLGFLVPGHKF